MPQQQTLPTECDIDEIAVGPNIRQVDAGSPAFRELVDSIKVHGLLEPMIVRPTKGTPAEGSHPFELVAGYRRREACRRAGLKVVPIRVVALNDSERAEVQLLENLLRKDLTPMEEARAVHNYSLATGLKPAEIAARLSMSPAWVKGRLSLLNLRPSIQEFLEDGRIGVEVAIVVASYPGDVQDAAAVEYTEGDLALDEGVARAKAEMDQLAANIQKQKAFAAKLSASEYKVCPECGGAPVRESYSGLAVCERWHEWSLVSGKVAGGAPSSQGRSVTSRPKIDRAETRTLRGTRTPQEILSEYLGGVQADYVVVAAHGGSVRIEIALSGKAVPDCLRTKTAASWYMVPVEYSNGQRTQVVVDGYDGPARRKTKAAARNFLAEYDDGPAPKEQKDLKAEIEKLLAGERADAIKRVARIKDRELLERAREAEAKGESRASLMMAMDDALEPSL